jgi:hypothetical protein
MAMSLAMNYSLQHFEMMFVLKFTSYRVVPLMGYEAGPSAVNFGKQYLVTGLITQFSVLYLDLLQEIRIVFTCKRPIRAVVSDDLVSLVSGAGTDERATSTAPSPRGQCKPVTGQHGTIQDAQGGNQAPDPEIPFPPNGGRRS